MTDNTYEKGMVVRRSVLGDEHVDRAEAGKNEFTEEFQEFITQNKDIYNQYKINLNIIDFNYIPNYLVADFTSLCVLCLFFE